MSWVKIQVKGGNNFDPDQDFLELNPQFRYHKPYCDLLEDDPDSFSKRMWVIFFMCDPDRSKNIFSEMDEQKRKEMLSETYYPDLDWKNKLFNECIESYSLDCLTVPQRAYKAEKELMMKREKVLRESKFTLDNTKIVKDGKGGQRAVVVKGTADQINRLQKDSLVIYERYDKIEQKFIDEQAQIRVKGGSKLSQVEKGGFW